jgi:hypothetical protein
VRTRTVRVLADLANAFRDLGVRWYVFGAQAVIAAGAPRLTEDVDVTVEVPRGGAMRVVKALAKHGIRLRDVGDVDTFIARTRVIPAVHVKTAMPVDVVLAGEGLEMEMLGRAQKRRLGKLQIPFVANEDLIALKILAGREKDLEDVRTLSRGDAHGIDWKVARARVALLGAALDDSTMVETFDALVGKKKKKR